MSQRETGSRHGSVRQEPAALGAGTPGRAQKGRAEKCWGDSEMGVGSRPGHRSSTDRGAQPAGQMAKGWAGLTGPEAPRALSSALWHCLWRPHRRNFPLGAALWLSLTPPSGGEGAGVAVLWHLSFLPLTSHCPTNSPEAPGRDRPCCARAGGRAGPFCSLQAAQGFLSIALPCSYAPSSLGQC